MPRRKSTLDDVLTRPAMNGGWDKLARQQDEQCERLVKVEASLEAVNARFDRWERPLKWIGRGVGAVLLALVVRLALDGIAHINLVLH